MNNADLNLTDIFLAVLQANFIALKIVGLLSWSWLVVFWPLAAWLAFTFVIVLVARLAQN